MLRLRIREESREPGESEERPDENHYVRSGDFELRTLGNFGPPLALTYCIGFGDLGPLAFCAHTADLLQRLIFEDQIAILKVASHNL